MSLNRYLKSETLKEFDNICSAVFAQLEMEVFRTGVVLTRLEILERMQHDIVHFINQERERK